MKRTLSLLSLACVLTMAGCGEGETVLVQINQPDQRPSTPEQSKPSDPGDAKPSNPGQTNPSNPGQTNPSNPGQTDPSNPGQTDPSNPGQTEPGKPGVLDPSDPAFEGCEEGMTLCNQKCMKLSELHLGAVQNVCRTIATPTAILRTAVKRMYLATIRRTAAVAASPVIPASSAIRVNALSYATMAS